MCMHDFFVSLSVASNLFLVALLTTPRTILSHIRLSSSSLKLHVLARLWSVATHESNFSPSCWSLVKNTYRSYVSFVSPRQKSSRASIMLSTSSHSCPDAGQQPTQYLHGLFPQAGVECGSPHFCWLILHVRSYFLFAHAILKRFQFLAS